jgi:hypothetical protein
MKNMKEGMITKRLRSKMNVLRRGDDPKEMNTWILLYHIKKD